MEDSCTNKIKDFKQLSEHVNLEHLDRKISIFEVKFSMKLVKNKKACDTDGIASELTFIALIKVAFTLMVLNQKYTGCCTGLSPTLFLIFVDSLMIEIESKISFLPSLQFIGPYLLLADDLVGLSDSKQGLQDMINVVRTYMYSKKWRFRYYK